MTSELKGWARPRPIRIAFLVQDGIDAELILDGIFANCYGRWGGRFSLIVPCIDAQIPTAYWDWLQAYDPDIIYSYVPLRPDQILEIHERVSPAIYMYHPASQNERRDLFGYKPNYRISPLSSLSLVFRLSRYNPAVDGISGLRIIDSWHTERPSRFLTDNFGTYHTSQGGLFPADATASLLTIVSPEHQVNPQLGVPKTLTTVPTELAAFVHFAERKATSLSMLSIQFAPKLEVDAGELSRSFNLVVGESFSDRILFWNTRLLIPAWLDTELCCFRVTIDQLRNREFIPILGEMLRRRNHVNAGSGGQPQVTIRSTSLNIDSLTEAQHLLVSERIWGNVTTHVVASTNDLIPPQGSLLQARESNRFGSNLFPKTEWQSFVWSGDQARPPATLPDHLSDAPARQSFTNGYWAIDYTFGYGGLRLRFSSNRWMLPRRWRIAGAFKVTVVGDTNNFILPSARRSRHGNLAVIVNEDHPVETIRIPTAEAAIRHALAVEGRWARPDAQNNDVMPAAKFGWTEPSNEQRYLSGVLGMAGGLHRAAQFLLHPFLREVFARLGGDPNPPIDKITPTINSLRKRVTNMPSFDLRFPKEREMLAHFIVKAARGLKTPPAYICYQKLKSDWKSYRADYWRENPQQGQADKSVDWDKYEEDSLDNCLIEMRKNRLLFQGHHWTCPECHHRNWVDLANLKPDLACEICATSSQAPVAVDWLFRPNEFLIESLRDHSALSIIWVLSTLADRCRTSFLYLGPTCLGFSPDATSPDAEADLLALMDGQAVFCEIKSSWHSVRVSEIENFVALALRLRPDIAIFAVMENGKGLQNEIQAAQAELGKNGIAFELLIPGTSKMLDGPQLRFDEE